MTGLRFGRREPVIGIDASRLNVAHRTGTETYTWETLRAMAELAPGAPIRLYLNAERAPDSFRQSWEERPIPFPRFWTHARLSVELSKHPPALLWVPAHVIPLNHPKSVVTIHDLGYLHHPEGHTAKQRRTLDLTTRWSSRVAEHIIAISEITKRDLIDRYGVRPEKVTVIPHGVSDRFAPAGDEAIASLRDRYHLDRPYVLAVGTVQPRKNYAGLARAMAAVAEYGFPHQLVIAGKPGWLADQVRAEIGATGIRDDVRFLNYVPESDLPALYSGADLVAFPSWFEGFGLPALEAMRCGAPVIVSDRGSLPEIVGDAAIVFDPGTDGELTEAISRVLTDQALRDDLVARGLAHSATFTWQATAEKTLALLAEHAGLPRDSTPPW